MYVSSKRTSPLAISKYFDKNLLNTMISVDLCSNSTYFSISENMLRLNLFLFLRFLFLNDKFFISCKILYLIFDY